MKSEARIMDARQEIISSTILERLQYWKIGKFLQNPGTIFLWTGIVVPPPNEVGGGYTWNHLVRLSVRPSVRDMVSGA